MFVKDPQHKIAKAIEKEIPYPAVQLRNSKLLLSWTAVKYAEDVDTEYVHEVCDALELDFDRVMKRSTLMDAEEIIQERVARAEDLPKTRKFVDLPERVIHKGLILAYKNHARGEFVTLAKAISTCLRDPTPSNKNVLINMLRGIEPSSGEVSMLLTPDNLLEDGKEYGYEDGIVCYDGEYPVVTKEHELRFAYNEKQTNGRYLGHDYFQRKAATAKRICEADIALKQGRHVKGKRR